jgi:hypothetical protein
MGCGTLQTHMNEEAQVTHTECSVEAAPPAALVDYGREAHDHGRLHARRAQEVCARQVAHVVRHLEMQSKQREYNNGG